MAFFNDVGNLLGGKRFYLFVEAFSLDSYVTLEDKRQYLSWKTDHAIPGMVINFDSPMVWPVYSGSMRS